MEAAVIPLSSSQTLKWESSDTSIATVNATSSGAVITGVKDGDVEIRATSEDGRIVSSVNVYVTHKTKP
ncbi:Bacterial Ig-like domain (group 2) [compost metagenome]